jgi:AraC family transcriptional regulator
MCNQAAPIFQAIEFIESHLQEDITVAQIADAAGYSLFHFMRKFNQMVHHTPYDYLMRRRLTEAANALIHGNQRIIDIAQDYCFNDQETFSRVFRKMFQMTPSQCRKEKGFSIHNLLHARTMKEINFINSDQFQNPEVIAINKLHLHGLMTHLEDDRPRQVVQREGVCKDFLAESFSQTQVKVYELEFRLNSRQQTHYYFIGAEESYFKDQSPLLVEQSINEGQFVRMEVPESALQIASDYLHSTWIPRIGLTVKNGMIISSWNYEKNSKERKKTLMIPIGPKAGRTKEDK